MKPPKRNKTRPKLSKRLIDLDEVIDKVPVTRQTLINWEREGKFPLRISLNDDGSRICWLESEVDAFIDQRVAASRSHLPAEDRSKTGAELEPEQSDELEPAE